ncbi:hypothetical protein ABI59_07920 [Acidobacteria bacterium Mor1]|nr:hypothetical protein ABI59_07920 [Acidobacteria bacterium Mor1]
MSVDISPADAGCTARVRYDLTGLTPKGDRFIEGVTEDCFDGWIAEWRQAIEHYLSTGERLVTHRVQPVEGAGTDSQAGAETHEESIDG